MGHGTIIIYTCIVSNGQVKVVSISNSSKLLNLCCEPSNYSNYFEMYIIVDYGYPTVL